MTAIEDYVKENMGVLVDFLKARGQYRIDAPDVEYVEDDEEENEVTEETSEITEEVVDE